MSTKPTLIVVPGSFSYAAFYDTVTKPLAAKGIESETVELRTAGKKPGNPTMADDAAEIQSIASKYIDQGKDVVLVAHSYGGGPTSESVKGITKAEREKQGKKGGVVRLAYLTAVVPEVGKATADVLGGDQTEEEQKPYTAVDEDGWMYHHDPAYTASIVFNDLTPEEGTEWVKKFPQHSAISFAGQLTHPGYAEVPVSWLFCENDKCVKPHIQQAAIDMIEKAGGRKVDVTRINTDHVPNVGAPQKVVDWFVHLVEISAN